MRKRATSGGSHRQPQDVASRRRELAYQAARIMADGQMTEFEHARRKAAERSGVTDKRLWPDNEEIQALLLEQQRIFGGESRERQTHGILQHALDAMQLFDAFHPRLIGAALAGTAAPPQGIELQLFADNSEAIIWTLIDQRIPWKADAGQFRYAGGACSEHPIVRFLAGGIPVRLIVLPLNARRNPPLDPVTNRPLRGANRQDLQRRLQQANRHDPHNQNAEDPTC